MRSWVPAFTLAVVLVAGCGSDEADPVQTTGIDTTTTTTARPPTVCATTEATADRTVTIKVDDDADGFGAFGTTTPAGLTAGPVRLVVAAAEDNPQPVDVVVLDANDDAVFEFVGVPAGVSCGADVELVAGTYGVRHGDDEKSFEVS